MAYQNVGTPRFYINVIEWLNSLNAVTLSSTWTGSSAHYNTLPVVLETLTTALTATNVPKGVMTDQSFVAVLGHTMATDGDTYHMMNDSANVFWTGLTDVTNGDISSGTVTPGYDGFSITLFNSGETLIEGGGIAFNVPDNNAKLGSVIIGSYYDMPHSPGLKLTMLREMDGVKRERTKGGNDLVHHKYFRSPKWGNLPAWEQSYNATNPPSADYYSSSRVGRKTWDLSWNYVRGSDLFGANESLGNYNPPDPNYSFLGGYYPMVDLDSDTINSYGDDASYTEDIGNYFNSNLLTDDNFFSQVIHKTNGGQLPFIFQPDSNNNNPDQFAICKFDIKRGFQFKQVAKGLYNIKLKIREVW